MEKIFTILFLIFTITFTSVFASPRSEAKDPEPESQDFWPPDMIPHPHPPGNGPSGPGDPDMA